MYKYRGYTVHVLPDIDGMWWIECINQSDASITYQSRHHDTKTAAALEAQRWIDGKHDMAWAGELTTGDR